MLRVHRAVYVLIFYSSLLCFNCYRAGKQLEGMLASMGAVSIHQRRDVDLEVWDPAFFDCPLGSLRSQQDWRVINSWITGVIASLSELSLSSYPDYLWQKKLSGDLYAGNQRSFFAVCIVTALAGATCVNGHMIPEVSMRAVTKIGAKKRPYYARVQVKRLLTVMQNKDDKVRVEQPPTRKLFPDPTPLTPPQETFHLELDLADSGLEYTSGDSLAIYPQNDPLLVSRVIRLLRATGQEQVDVPTHHYIEVRT